MGSDRPHPTGPPARAGSTSPASGEVKWGFATRALHVGQGPDPATGAVVLPIAILALYRDPLSPVFVASVIIALFVFWTHRAN